ncbi:MAG TPA: integrase arm-type DNA-binding domain-containing protein [Paracoccus sp. (in: a-proteobacteria)]|uniref:tyrosine-type recombinase/integrase n=1 Tax=Paracoccus sp. TaxID=267 RepID=UPI002D00319B|nr:integrase arm-type DNA-binding domain-containing protein [Paracoccus sp. (in: a-proteobacteria)]HWL56318.1 integrase arm-type DNA-binding domain-containing protein [Paracoccus sp. (in: a-proteobacteria)]
MRLRGKLTNLSVKSLSPGKHCDGDGLWLHKTDESAKWVFRFSLSGRRREMGLGSTSHVTLAQARGMAREARTLVMQGKDPIRDRRDRAAEAAQRDVTFAQLTELAFEARKDGLKDGGKAGNWMSPLAVHVLPKIGHLAAKDVNQHDIVDVLKPIWRKSASIAAKALERIGIVLQHGAAMDLPVDVTARTKARALLGDQKHVATHIPAMPWREVPDFYKTLTKIEGKSSLALRFVILTGARSAEVRELHLSEIKGRIWTIPAARMKNGKEHRVPLSDEALAVIEAAKAVKVAGHIFIGPSGKPLSDMSLSKVMKARGLSYRPHGFRSSWRDWAGEVMKARHEVAEAQLAHLTGSKVSRAYARSDYLEERADLMATWADFVTGKAANDVAA